ncbi:MULTISPECIES: hypothetical protein [Streptomyces]|uniref:Uncharacterized protein n=2 Tax=Streptomyces TaxID=1883 RepID=A0ABV9IPT7_9ACTN
MNTLTVIDELEVLLDGSWDGDVETDAADVYKVVLEGTPKGNQSNPYGFC